MLVDKNLYNLAHKDSLEAFQFYQINVGRHTVLPNTAEFYADKDGNPLDPFYYTNRAKPFVYDGIVYQPIKIEDSGATQDTSGKLSELSLTVANLDGFLQYYIEEYDLCGNTVIVGLVLVDLADESVFAVVQDEFRISAISIDDTQATFSLSCGIDVLRLSLPGRKAYSQLCPWEFGGEDCKKVKAPGEKCSQTWLDCQLKNNTKNFGGFPGILNERFYF